MWSYKLCLSQNKLLNKLSNEAIRGRQYIFISHLNNKMVKSIKDRSVCHHLLCWNYPSTFGNFSVLCHDDKKHLLEFEESILIMREESNLIMRDNSSMKSKHCSTSWTPVISILLLFRVITYYKRSKEKCQISPSST